MRTLGGHDAESLQTIILLLTVTHCQESNILILLWFLQDLRGIKGTDPCWLLPGVSGTKQLYEPDKPVVYIVPIASILGRLPLIPAGDHGTIPAALRGRERELFPLGKCDDDGRPGTGSKLYYISSWAMCWPTDHPKRPVTG